MKVLVCGSRNWNDYHPIYMRLRDLPPTATVIHGAARGADSLAETIAVHWCGLPVQAFPADWKTHGRRAGILRTNFMLDQQPDLVIAFWDGKSRGTYYTIAEAQRRGIPVEICLTEDHESLL